MQCPHDEHAGNHALIMSASKDSVGPPDVVGVRCWHANRCSDEVGLDDYTKVSFGDDFVVDVNVMRKRMIGVEQHRIRRFDRCFVEYFGRQPRVDQIMAANRIAEYYTLAGDSVNIVTRINCLGKESIINGIRAEYNGCCTLHMAAAFDDSSLISVGSWNWYYAEQIRLFDVTTDNVKRAAKCGRDAKDCPDAFTPHGQNTWIARLRNHTTISMYDDRVDEWNIATYEPKMRSNDEYIDMSSCIGDLVLMQCANGMAKYVSAVDIRNGYRYDLAAVCSYRHVVHLQL